MSENCIAFAGHTCVASGSLAYVAVQAKRLLDEDPTLTVLVLDSSTSEPIEVDLRGTVEDVLARLAPATPAAGPTGPENTPDGAEADQVKALGRPRLGVVAREVTLLPRHWEWLNEQPGGASVTLRKLVEEARRSTSGATRIRRAQEACYRFMNTMAGNEPGFEEALRALYADDSARFAALTEEWPTGVRNHARQLAEACFTSGS